MNHLWLLKNNRKLVKIAESVKQLFLCLANDELEKAMRISQKLRMQKEIEGIQDRTETIRDLTANGLQWLGDGPLPEAAAGNEAEEQNTTDVEELFENLLISEEEESRRREDQCTD